MAMLDERMTRGEQAWIDEQKRAALEYLTEAWSGALAEGIEPDILANAALFAALSELVGVYGENAVAELAAGLPDRIRCGDFTRDRSLQ